jgi:hypothetical protein
MAAAAVASGVSAHAMSGGGSESSSSSSNSGSSSSNASNVQQTSSSGGGSKQTVSVAHLAEGGIVSRRTLFMAGDDKANGNAEEAIVPLSDPDAVSRISTALLSPATLRAASAASMAQSPALATSGDSRSDYDSAPSHVSSASGRATAANGHTGSGADPWGTAGPSGGGDTHVHFHLPKGSVIGNVKHVMREINKYVQKGQAELLASNSLRVTRRSQ